MPAIAAFLIGLLLGIGIPAASTAAVLPWAGTLTVEISGAAPFVIAETGVATINGSAGQGHLSTLGFPGGFSNTTTLPITDPGLPPTLISMQVVAQLAAGSLAHISGGPPLSQGVMLMMGTANLCMLWHWVDETDDLRP